MDPASVFKFGPGSWTVSEQRNLSSAPFQQGSSPHASSQTTGTAQFECTVPNCGKAFQRKEHLTRHIRSHGPVRPHKCYICERSFARSDILKRHVLQHNNSTESTKRTLVACNACRKRKLKCDSKEPCLTCRTSGVECLRTPSSTQKDASVAKNLANFTAASKPLESWPITAPTSNFTAHGETWGDDQGMWDDGLLGFSSSLSSVDGSFLDSLLLGGAPSKSVESLESYSDVATHFPTSRQLLRSGSGQRSYENSWSMTSGSTSPTPGFTFSEMMGVQHDTLKKVPISGDCSSANTELLWNQHCMDIKTLGQKPPSAPQTPTNMPLDLVQELEIFMENENLDIPQLIKAYFTNIHPLWPILHAPSFDHETTPPTLLAALTMVASWSLNTPFHKAVAPRVLNILVSSLLPRIDPSSACYDIMTLATLPKLQALVIALIYAITCDSSDCMRGWAIQLNNIMVSVFRQLRVFSAHRVTNDCADSNKSDRWLKQEQIKRLGFAALRIDAYLSCITNHPQSLRHYEISVPLPVSESLWGAVRTEDRVSLQWSAPAGRGKRLFSSLVRDALLTKGHSLRPLRLIEADYHLGLCALQPLFWDAAQECLSCEHDIHADLGELDDTEVEKLSEEKSWRLHLNYFRRDIEADCQIGQKFYSCHSTCQPTLSSTTLMIYHLLQINMHADAKLLQVINNCYECNHSGFLAENHRESRIRKWLCTPGARTAVFHAAQLRRAFVQESKMALAGSGKLLNPLAMTGLLRSAIVLCAYAIRTRACSHCTGNVIPGSEIKGWELISETMNELESMEKEEWIEHGGLAYLDGVPVCSCRMPDIAAWYQRMLGTKVHLSQKFADFLFGLKDRPN